MAHSAELRSLVSRNNARVECLNGAEILNTVERVGIERGLHHVHADRALRGSSRHGDQV